MDTTTWHLAFIVAAAATAGFALVMQRRLRLNYPGDDSMQMRSMLGFLRGIAMLAMAILVLAAANLLRVTLT